METHTMEGAGVETLERLVADLEEAYREELHRVRRFGGDLAKARRLYRQRQAYREALATRVGASGGPPLRRAA